MGGLRTLFRRKPRLASAVAAPREDMPVLVGGEMRTVAALRSSWSRNGVIWLGNEDAAPSDYDSLTLARTYKASMTAFVCINVRAGVDAEIPVHVVGASGKPTRPTPADAFLLRAQRSVWAAMAAQLIWGSYYFLKIRNAGGYPTDLQFLSPLDVRPEYDYAHDCVRAYWVTTGMGEVEYAPEQIVAVHTFNPLSDFDGTSALEVAMRRAEVEINLSKFARAFFKNSGRPDVILTYRGGTMAEPERKRVRDYWDSLFKGAWNAFRTAILGGDWDIKTLQADLENLAMTDLSDQTDVKICSVMGVNPALAGLGKVADALSAQSTYKQIRQNHIEFVAIPDIRHFCEALNEQWLHRDFPAGRWTLEPDTAAMTSEALGAADRIATATTAAGRLWAISEAREYTGKPVLEGAIDRNPDWALALWQAAVITRNEARQAIGMANAGVDGFIYDLDPRAQPAAPLLPLGGALSAGPGNSRGTLSLPPETMDVTAITPRRDERQMAQLHELGLWAKRVKRDGPAARFQVEVLPPNVETWVRAELNAGQTPKEVFDTARAWVRTGQEPTRVDEAQALDFWREYDQIQAEIGTTWIESYMAKTWEVLQGKIGANGLGDDEILMALQAFESDLLQAWIGTPETPGPMYKMALAGMAAGQRELEGAAASRTRSAVRAPNLKIQIDWSLLSEEALRFIERYLPTLIKNVSQTTLELTRQTIEAWLKTGEPLDVLKRALTNIYEDKARAALIAQTESTRLYFEGATDRYQQAGVTRGRWDTARDGLVCEICGPLHNTVAPLNVGWRHNNGKTYRPPAHPGCRCGARPVLED